MKAKAKVKTQATLKVEAKVQDNDLATDNSLVGGQGEGKGRNAKKTNAEGGSEGQ